MHLLLSSCLLLLGSAALSQPYPPVPVPPGQAAFGTALPRTAHRLQAGTPPGGQPVRVLVYGQSVSMQDWWLEVRRLLEARYPQTRIEMENRAIGGFSSERLKQMVENDVVPFYPDLVLFHDYGNEADYEQIVRTVRSRTTAEMALQTDHVAIGQDSAWHDRHSSEWMPALCRKYGLGLMDVRSAWKAYLYRHNLPAAALLSDHVHLNAHGNYLMAGIISQYLGALPTAAPAGKAAGTLRAGRDFSIRRNRTAVPLAGNRVTLVWDTASGPAAPVRIRVDGQPPSTRTDCYFHTRPATDSVGFFLRHMGQLLSLQLAGRPQAETWTLTVTAVDTVRQQLQFALQGSRTGEDGTGGSDSVFRSHSGRIVITPADWFRRNTPGDFGQFRWIRAGETLRWRVVARCRDTVAPPPAGPAEAVVLPFLAPGRHRLELEGRSLHRLREIRVAQPPLSQ